MDQVFPPSIVLLGPTASGKTRLACQVAYSCGGGVISADSRQVYQGLDIGTGKDLSEFVVQDTAVPYYLIDHVAPGSSYDVAQFQTDFFAVLSEFSHPMAVVCGGTGLYLQAILQGYTQFQYPVQEELRAILMARSYEELLEEWNPPVDFPVRVDTSTKKRLIRGFEILASWKKGTLPHEMPVWKPAIVGLDIPRDVRRQRISDRLHTRIQEGMVEEVAHLLQAGISQEWLTRLGLEYAWVVRLLAGEISVEDFKAGLEVSIHQMAKRQMTFFRSMEKKGLPIHWIDGLLPEEKILSEIKKKIPMP